MISPASDRPNRPTTAAEAQDRFDKHLDDLAANAPRRGLGAATGKFVDDLVRRSSRYKPHLFVCFDDPRIPANTNELERFFGKAKQDLRHALGSGSTTNSIVANLGADVLISYHYVQQVEVLRNLVEDVDSESFEKARNSIANEEKPGTRRRSLVRNLDQHLARLRVAWHGRDPPSG